MSQTPEKSESPISSEKTDTGSPENAGNSVPDVIFLPDGPVAGSLQYTEFIKAKCTTCDTVTEQASGYLQVAPAGAITEEIAGAIMQLRKRLVFCTHCGNYRIKS